MDPAFRLLHALMRAKDLHRSVGRLLPDWPPIIKDMHASERDALSDAWAALWDVYAPDGEYTTPATVGLRNQMIVSEAEASTRLDGETHCEDEVDAADATTRLELTHAYEPPPMASLHDEPPSVPVPLNEK